MRSPPRLPETSQTPALPGFAVYGDAKNAGFEAFGVSPKLHPILSMTQVRDPSVLTPANRHHEECVQKTAPFERVQIPASVEHRHWPLGAFAYLRQARSFERVQMGSSTRHPPSTLAKSLGSSRTSASFERVQLTAASRSDGTRSNRPRETQPAFERVQTSPPSGQPPDTVSAAPPFERVQMTRERTNFPVTPRPTRPPHRRPPRMTPAHEPPLRSIATPKQETPMSSTQ